MATFNSIAGAVSLSVNLYTILLLKIYNQRRQLDILILDANILEEYCVWKGQATREEVCVSNPTFFNSKTIHLKDDEPRTWWAQFVSVSFFQRK